MRFVVLLDACVLYPAPLRDLLLSLAASDLFAAKWTDAIHDEWTRSVLKYRPEIEEAISRTRDAMDRAVPDCKVENYEDLVDGLELPDPDDRHVLAAAIKCGAQAIVTFNLKDFPADILAKYGIEALHPDAFVELQLSLNQGKVLNAVKQQRSRLRNPPKTAAELLETFSAQGLVVTADLLKEFAELI